MSFITIIISILFFLIAGLVFSVGAKGIYNVSNANNFCTTKGKILNSEVEVNVSGTADKLSADQDFVFSTPVLL